MTDKSCSDNLVKVLPIVTAMMMYTYAEPWAQVHQLASQLLA